jgi:DNA-binding CsgD family transcriptional regulator
MIRLYKDLGQADFNAEPGFVYSPPRFEPKSQRCKERAAKILELVHQGHPRKEIAQLLQVAESEISKVCRSNNLWALPGQKKGGGKGYGRKLMRSQYEEILRRDDKDESHADIGKLFGVSRERIRQICKAAGHPDRRDRAKRVTASQREAARVERQRIRALKKITPTRMALAFADLWKEGKTLGEIAVAMGRTRGSMGVKLVRCRKRYPSLFPYRYAGWERRIQQQKEAA